MRGLSTAIFMVIVLLLLFAVLVPAFILFSSTSTYSYQGEGEAQVYRQLQEQQVNQVYRGNPNIYYNSSSVPHVVFQYVNLPAPLNISQIYYFDPQTANWVPMLKNNLIVASNFTLALPVQAFNEPIIIVTAEGNMFFLNPNTSVISVNFVGPSGKIPVYVTAIVINGSKAYPVPLEFVLGTYLVYYTPQILELLPGSYSIADKNSTTIFIPQYGFAATFQNWSLIGDGYFISPADSPSTNFNVYGPLVLTLVYKAVSPSQKFTVTIKPSGIPLGSSISGGSGVTLVSMNSTVPVYVDNKLYQVNSSGLTLTLSAGFHTIVFPAQYNITFDYENLSSSNSYFQNLPGGEVITYNFSGLSTSTSGIAVVGDDEVFVGSSGTIYGNFVKNWTYYLVKVENCLYVPSGVHISNNKELTGDLAGQLLIVHIGGVNYTWGPVKDNVPQELYLRQGTNVSYVKDLNDCLHVPINLQGNKKVKTELYNITNVTVETPSNELKFSSSTSSPGSISYFIVNYPVLIINYQELEWYGESP